MFCTPVSINQAPKYYDFNATRAILLFLLLSSTCKLNKWRGLRSCYALVLTVILLSGNPSLLCSCLQLCRRTRKTPALQTQPSPLCLITAVSTVPFTWISQGWDWGPLAVRPAARRSRIPVPRVLMLPASPSLSLKAAPMRRGSGYRGNRHCLPSPTWACSRNHGRKTTKEVRRIMVCPLLYFDLSWPATHWLSNWTSFNIKRTESFCVSLYQQLFVPVQETHCVLFLGPQSCMLWTALPWCQRGNVLSCWRVPPEPTLPGCATLLKVRSSDEPPVYTICITPCLSNHMDWKTTCLYRHTFISFSVHLLCFADTVAQNYLPSLIPNKLMGWKDAQSL